MPLYDPGRAGSPTSHSEIRLGPSLPLHESREAMERRDVSVLAGGFSGLFVERNVRLESLSCVNEETRTWKAHS